MKNILTIVSILLISSTAFAQGEYNNWVFGDSIWLDFNSGSPVQNLASKSSNGAASTSISDKNGNLLFYADSDSIWDASHNPMLNGSSLPAHGGIQGSNAVPTPCNDTLFYVLFFENSANNNQNMDLRYAVLNMNGNGGLGEVVVNNVILDTDIAMALGMTRHSNNTDYWITYQLADTNVFYSRQISASGIGLPVISQLGSNKTYSGTLKFSSDGAHLVNCSRNDQFAEHYDFDNSTGLLSNAFLLNIPTSIGWYQPISSQFSPDLSKLYVTLTNSILQYDFNLNNQTTIANSGVIIAQATWGPPLVASFFDIALTPTNVMYISRLGFTSLAIINQPNNLGSACGFVNHGLNTNRATGAGFPTMLPNLFVHRDVLTDSLLCQYDTINLYLSDTNYIDSLVWNFGDTASGLANTSTDVIPLHVYNTYGTYPIEVIIYSGCVNDTIHDTIRINPTPIANLGPDTILCEGDSMQLLFNDTSFNYLWSTGDSSMSIQILNSDTFSIAISSICGVDYDTIVIDFLIPSLVHLPNDTLLCDGDSLLLDATIQSGNYLWSTTDTLNSIWATNQNVYWVAAQNFCGSDTDTVVVNYTHHSLILAMTPRFAQEIL